MRNCYIGTPKEENGFLEMIFSFSRNLMDEKTGFGKDKKFSELETRSY